MDYSYLLCLSIIIEITFDYEKKSQSVFIFSPLQPISENLKRKVSCIERSVREAGKSTFFYGCAIKRGGGQRACH